MKSVMNIVTERTRESVLEFTSELADRLSKETAGLIGRNYGDRITVVLENDSELVVDVRDIDEDALVLSVAVTFDDQLAAELRIPCDDKGQDRVVAAIKEAQDARKAKASNRKWKLDIVHDRLLTAESELNDALGPLGELADKGHIGVELHDSVYDLHKEVRRKMRAFDKLRRQQ